MKVITSWLIVLVEGVLRLFASWFAQGAKYSFVPAFPTMSIC